MKAKGANTNKEELWWHLDTDNVKSVQLRILHTGKIISIQVYKQLNSHSNVIAVDAVDAVVGESERVVAGTTRVGESAARGDGARETGERGEIDGDEGRGRERDEEGRREIA